MSRNKSGSSAGTTTTPPTGGNSGTGGSPGGGPGGGGSGGGGPSGNSSPNSSRTPSPATTPAPYGLHPIETLKDKGYQYHDYSTKLGYDIYKQGCKPLDGETKVPLTATGLATLKPLIQTRMQQQNWTCLNIINKAGDTVSLIDSYGQLTFDELKQKAQHEVGQHLSRFAQDDVQFGQALMQSLTPEAKAKLAIYKKDYDLTSASGSVNTSGILLFKIFVRESVLDSNVSTEILETELVELPNKMINEMKGNPKEYIKKLQELIVCLEARGRQPHMALYVLWRGLEKAACASYRRWLEDRREEHNSGAQVYIVDTLLTAM